MKSFGLVLLCCSVAFGGTSMLTFTKSFPGSVPEFAFVSVERNGALCYKEALTDDKPVLAQLPATDTDSLFGMADKLDRFKSPIESGLKVANTGKKIFRYTDESGKNTETTFNYSTNEIAQQLLERFEQIAATERAYLDLDRTVHFDHLGVNQALADVESLWLKKQLAAPAQFVPLLTRIINRESLMHLARDRAARLKDEFTAMAQAPVAEQQAK